ncbi:MAG: type 2 isopentenyl-diphosphate Delta-isomerase [Acidobacteria bacterium]|nr:MAG: type 2 isopentenyl-diphosphate Delta-isomerase [Acidobacteriota bacterium]
MSGPLPTTRPPAAERDRKLEHIELSLDQRTQLDGRFFDRYALRHEALPEIALDDVELTTELFGKTLAAPLLVSCMTGGTSSAATINQNLARGAERAGIALGVGSQRKALESPETRDTFHVRDLAPSVPILANLGAVQLNYGFGIEQCRQAVRMVDADALALHLNPLQEAIQPEGQCNFRDLLPQIGAIVRRLEVPVVVKEIGCGISGETGRALRAVGVEWIDTAGLGGTSWARIEAARAEDVPLGELFADWGVPTPQSIRQLAAIDGVRVIGSGGVRNGVDAAKAIALGAEVVGLAQPFLKAAMVSADAVYERIQRVVHELRIAMFCCGARTLRDLRNVPLIER